MHCLINDGAVQLGYEALSIPLIFEVDLSVVVVASVYSLDRLKNDWGILFGSCS